MNASLAKRAELYGCTECQLRYLTRVARFSGNKSPIKGFCNHRASAKQRGIEFHLSLWDWWLIWLMSGHWEQRGTSRDSYCMARHGDVGPYAVGNVSIIPLVENSRQVSANYPFVRDAA